MPPHGTLWQNAASRHLLGSRPRSRLVEVSLIEIWRSLTHQLRLVCLHPQSLTWNLKMMVSKFGISFFRLPFSGSMLIFRGCIPLGLGDIQTVLGFPWDFWTEPSTVLLGYPFCNLSCGQCWQCLEITSAGWWLNQPIRKIGSSNWKSSPNRGEN